MLTTAQKNKIAREITEEIWKSTENYLELGKYCELGGKKRSKK